MQRTRCPQRKGGSISKMMKEKKEKEKERKISPS